MKRILNKIHSGRRGQALVEFALILPLFVLLVFGAIEFGRAYYTIHLLTNAAREGARVGSLPNQLESDVQARVTSFLQDVGLSGTWTTTVQCKDASGTARAGLASAVEGDRVAVVIAYDFHVLTGRILPHFVGTVHLRGRCTFRHE